MNPFAVQTTMAWPWQGSPSSRSAARKAPPAPPPPRLSFDRIDTAEEASLVPMFEPGLVSLLRTHGSGGNVRVDVDGTIEAGGTQIPVQAQLRTHRQGLTTDGELVGRVGDQQMNMSYSGQDGTVRLRGKIGANPIDITHSRTAMQGTTYVAGMIGAVAVDVFMSGMRNLNMRGSMGLDPCLVRVTTSTEDESRRFSGRLGSTQLQGSVERVGENEYVLTQVRGDVKLTERIRFSTLAAE